MPDYTKGGAHPPGKLFQLEGKSFPGKQKVETYSPLMEILEMYTPGKNGRTCPPGVRRERKADAKRNGRKRPRHLQRRSEKRKGTIGKQYPKGGKVRLAHKGNGAGGGKGGTTNFLLGRNICLYHKIE